VVYIDVDATINLQYIYNEPKTWDFFAKKILSAILCDKITENLEVIFTMKLEDVNTNYRCISKQIETEYGYENELLSVHRMYERITMFAPSSVDILL